jgi:hypothetical protein
VSAGPRIPDHRGGRAREQGPSVATLAATRECSRQPSIVGLLDSRQSGHATRHRKAGCVTSVACDPHQSTPPWISRSMWWRLRRAYRAHVSPAIWLPTSTMAGGLRLISRSIVDGTHPLKHRQIVLASKVCACAADLRHQRAVHKYSVRSQLSPSSIHDIRLRIALTFPANDDDGIPHARLSVRKRTIGSGLALNRGPSPRPG